MDYNVGKPSRKKSQVCLGDESGECCQAECPWAQERPASRGTGGGGDYRGVLKLGIIIESWD